jgi:glutamate/tyrosine decarboxylase-like PLP-dependent enzyme
LLLPNLNELKESFDLRADYLFHDNNAEDDDDYVDLGKHSLVCSKYFDALPLWVILQCYGLDYFRSQIDENVSLTHFVNQYLNTSTDLIAAHKAIAPVVCFRFRPGGFEGQEAPEEREYFNTLHQAVRKKAKELGRAQFGSVKLGGYQHFRIVFANPRINQFDLRELLTELASLCWDYLEEHPPVFVERVEESFKIANQP